jgi:hypothetical protein
MDPDRPAPDQRPISDRPGLGKRSARRECLLAWKACATMCRHEDPTGVERAAVDEQNENPVANGLVALVAVALVIGLLAAIIALLGTRLFGLDGSGGSGSGDGVAVGDSLYLPSLQPTELDSGLLVTLAPVDTETPEATEATEATETPEATESASASPTESATPNDTRIGLSAGSSSVGSGEELMLSGTYSRGEGSVLDIWYDVNGTGWKEFNLDVNVYGGVFQVFVATYQTGRIAWRVQDPETGLESNEVTVQHGDE